MFGVPDLEFQLNVKVVCPIITLISLVQVMEGLCLESQIWSSNLDSAASCNEALSSARLHLHKLDTAQRSHQVRKGEECAALCQGCGVPGLCGVASTPATAGLGATARGLAWQGCTTDSALWVFSPRWAKLALVALFQCLAVKQAKQLSSQTHCTFKAHC